MKENVDIHAVARAARTSISTVSRSFNHPQLVNPATRRRIERAVRKLGYIRNRAAQTMHGRRSGTVGLVVPTIDHAIFAELIQAFSDAVDAQGFTMLVASHGYDLEREYAVVRKFLEHRVDGIALIGQDHSEETFALLESQNVPATTIWNYSPSSRLPCVGADNHAAGAAAVAHLTTLGHRDIGLVFPPVHGNDRARDRLNGTLQALEKNGLSVPPAWQLETPYSITAAKEATRPLLRAAPRPTAFLCGNDVLASGTIYAALAEGLQVPRDVSVMGIGDFKASREMEPGLTTIRLPARHIGQLGGEQLSRAILSPQDTVARQCCEIRLIDRATCAALPVAG